MPSTLTVATYNLWGYNAPSDYLRRRGIVRGAVSGSRAAALGPGSSVWAKRRSYLIDVLQRADPDVIALQENVRRPADGPERSHAHQLGRALGMTVVEGTWNRWEDPVNGRHELGVALLTHLPVDETGEGDLPYRIDEGLGGTPRILKVRLDLDGEPMWVWVTHFPVRVPERNLSCAEAVIDQAGAVTPTIPILLCGDLNTSPETASIRTLTTGRGTAGFTDLWTGVHPDEDGYTMPTPVPEARIDYLMLRDPTAAFSPVSAEILGSSPDGDGFFPSDHCGVRVVLER
jgi:endonuclease/exonuclease/phosphatase family metal-dependent hydrolase